MAVNKPLPVARFYRGWDVYQQQLVTAFTPLESAHLQLQAAPTIWSVGMLGNHIIAARAWWFHFWMKEGGDEFAEFADWDEGEAMAERSAAEIVQRPGGDLGIDRVAARRLDRGRPREAVPATDSERRRQAARDTRANGSSGTCSSTTSTTAARSPSAWASTA